MISRACGNPVIFSHKIVIIFLSTSLTLCLPMEFPKKFDTFKSGRSIVYIEGSQVIISKILIFLLLKIDLPWEIV